MRWSEITGVSLCRNGISKRADAHSDVYRFTEICPVCMDPVSDEQLLARFTCNHSLHFSCFRQMVRAAHPGDCAVKCPICKKEHPTKEASMEQEASSRSPMFIAGPSPGGFGMSFPLGQLDIRPVSGAEGENRVNAGIMGAILRSLAHGR